MAHEVKRASGSEYLEQAVAAFHEALNEFTQEKAPYYGAIPRKIWLLRSRFLTNGKTLPPIKNKETYAV